MTINDAKYIYFRQLLDTLRENAFGIKITQCNESFQWSIVSNTFIIYLTKYKGGIEGEATEQQLIDMDLDFKISFEVSTSPSDAAEIMKMVLTVVTPNDISITEEFFYDFDEEQLYVGKEATTQRLKNIQKKAGKLMCPCCERFVVKKEIMKSGFCSHCDQHIDSINFH